MIRNAFLKPLAALSALGMGLGLAGCGGVTIQLGESDGVPLDELDLSGAAPTRLALASGDTVVITEGDTLSITIEGDAQAREDLRFARDEDLLGIGRKSGLFGKDASPATIRVTMPAPRELLIGGSGTIEAPTLARRAELGIGGSGTIRFADMAGEKLEVSIGGSGKVKGAGTAERLEVSIGGKGDVDLAAFKVERGEVSIAGSGDVAFASDGIVESSIAGTGTVRVIGNATCTGNNLGSGKLICKPAAPAAGQ